MKKKIILCFMTAFVALSLVACGKEKENTTSEETTEQIVLTDDEEPAETHYDEETSDKATTEESAENPPLDPAADVFVGTWMVDRSIVVVRKSENNSMLVTVTNSPDSQTALAWNYECLYEDGDLVSLSTGTKATTTTTEDASSPNVEMNYSDGTARFHLENDVLTWIDDKEDAGKGLSFSQITQ